MFFRSLCVCVRVCIHPHSPSSDKSIKAFQCLSSLVLIIAVSHNSRGQNCRLVPREGKRSHPPVTAHLCVCVCVRAWRREITAFDHLAAFDWINAAFKPCFDISLFCLLLHNSIGSSRWSGLTPDAAFMSLHVSKHDGSVCSRLHSHCVAVGDCCRPEY